MHFFNTQLVTILIATISTTTLQSMHIKEIIRTHHTSHFNNCQAQPLSIKKSTFTIFNTDTTTKNQTALAKEYIGLIKEQNALAKESVILQYLNRIDAYFNAIDDHISRKRYPDIAIIRDCINTINELKHKHNVKYNPLGIRHKNNKTILANLLPKNIEWFMNNQQNSIKDRDIDWLINAGVTIYADEKRELHNKIAHYFKNNHVMTLNELEKIKQILTVLDEITPNSSNTVTAEEFLTKHTKPLITQQTIKPTEMPTKSIINNQQYKRQQFATTTEIQLEPIHDDLQKLYELETLNYVMNLYEHTIEDGIINTTLLCPHIQTAITTARKKGLDNKEKREKLLMKLRQKIQQHQHNSKE